MSMSLTIGDDRDDEPDDRRAVDRDDEDDRGTDSDSDRTDRKADRARDATDEPDDDADDDEGKSPEQLRAELKRLRTSLSKANSSGLRRRQQLKEVRAKMQQLDDAETADDDADDEDGEDKPRNRQAAYDARQVQRTVEKAVKKREREIEETHRRDIIDTRAESAFIRAGVSEKNIRLLKRELDYDQLELLKDRSVDGLEEEIDRLRSEFPDLFRRSRPGARRINGGDDRDGGGKRKTVESASARQAARLSGRG